MAKKKIPKHHLPLLVIAALILVVVLEIIIYTQQGTPFLSYVPSTSTINSSAFCFYGYVCNISADGCAAPGAVYNCPNEPVNPPSNISTANSTVAVNLTQELNNSAADGFALNQSIFLAGTASQCSKQLISQCNNNVPNQFVCVNQQYANVVSSQYSSIYLNPGPCPMFILEGNVFCGTANGYCVVMKSDSVQNPRV